MVPRSAYPSRAALRGVHGETTRGRNGGLARAGLTRGPAPTLPKAGTWAPPAASALAATLRATADECEAADLLGSAQRMRELAAGLDGDVGVESVREACRLIGACVARARVEGGAVAEAWEGVLPRGVKVPAVGGR
jgi:hypothetical protein